MAGQVKVFAAAVPAALEAMREEVLAFSTQR